MSSELRVTIVVKIRLKIPIHTSNTLYFVGKICAGSKASQPSLRLCGEHCHLAIFGNAVNRYRSGFLQVSEWILVEEHGRRRSTVEQEDAIDDLVETP